MRRLLLLALLALLAPPAYAQPQATYQALLPLVVQSNAASANLAVTTATYLGGSGADSAAAIDIAPNGTLVVAGTFPGYVATGVTPLNLLGGGTGAVVRLDASGKAVLSITRIGASVRDMEIDGAGRIVVCGDFGLAALAPDASALLWSASVGSASRCATGSDGTAATLVGGSVYAYDATGKQLGSWAAGGSAQNDIAVDGASQTVVVGGYTQKNVANNCSGLLQVAWLRAWSASGQQAWTSYDWSAQQAQAASLCADTRAERVSVGRDGKLYAAFSINGGTGAAIVARDPLDIAAPLGARLVTTDKFTNPYNTGSVKMAWFGRFNIANGALERSQSLLTRIPSTDKGNSITIKAITADTAGNVFIAGDSACCLKDRDTRQVASTTVGSYEIGEAFALALSADFATRLVWTPFAAPGGSAGGSPAEGIAVRGGSVALAATLNVKAGTQRGLITANALQPAPASAAASEGYVAVWQ